MAKPQKPQDVYVVNGWYLNIPVPGIMSDGMFETLEGMSKSSGTVEVVDAGTNRKYKFTDQLTVYGEMTLTRPYNGSAADRAMEVLVNTMIENGIKVPVTAVKMHQGQEVLTIIFEGFAFSAANYPTFDVGGSDKFTVSYTAHCDGWTILPAGA
jgi:hypothetical protein